MTLIEQVAAALTDEVLYERGNRICTCSMPECVANRQRRRDAVLSSLAPVLAQQEATVATLTAERDRARKIAARWHEERACPMEPFNDALFELDAKEIASWPK